MSVLRLSESCDVFDSTCIVGLFDINIKYLYKMHVSFDLNLLQKYILIINCINDKYGTIAFFDCIRHFLICGMQVL